MQTISRMPFTTVKTEGGILPADLLSRIAAGTVDGLQPTHYHLAPTERLNEAISRSWNRLLGVWRNFDDRRNTLDESDRGTTLTRESWLLILFQELGYGRLSFTGRLTIEDSTGDKRIYPISHLWEHTPIHLVSFRQELDRREAAVGRSPHSLLQEVLNRSSEALWGFTSNGLRLRLLRDNASLTRAAYIEFDLEAMLAGELYSDFSLLWLVCHQSRVERGVGREAREEAEAPSAPVPRPLLPSDCWLERWSQHAAEQGARALDALRDGVQEAINALGKGFLEHKANQQLRADLQAGRLSTYNYYRQLLRLVYRLIFLFVAEDRDLLLRPDATATARQRYQAYSIGRLRVLADARRGSPHPDLYRSLRLLMLKLRTGYEPLGLPGLGGFLFSDRATPHLDTADLANRNLLDAIRALASAVDNGVRRAVDYRNLDTEELGSVYESLLELYPQLNLEAATFALEVVAGSERKTTGSHYTPTPLVNSLLDTALEPVVADRLKTAEERWRQGSDRSQDALRHLQEAALLSIKVLDYAVGSGHMLIGAGRRLARHLARIRTGDEEPSPDTIRAAMRDVVGHCLYGVDINEMAVELCKVALWMETLEPGKPLTFLDKNIQCGNSLIGVTPALLEQGIPDEVFIPIEGDDKAYCQEWKRRNKVARTGQRSLYQHDLQPWERLGALATAMAQMEATRDDTLAGVQQQEQMYAELVRSSGYRYGQLLADAWCAAFVWKKTNDFAYPITHEVFRRIEHNPFDVAPWMVEEIERLRTQYQFFHWHLAFPQVFTMPVHGQTPDHEQMGWNGGFDVVLSNPPWDKIQPEEQKFFAPIRLDIALAETATIRKKMIANLALDDPATNTLWVNHKRHIEAVGHLLRNSGILPLTSQGNLNSYRLFAELASCVVSADGRTGLIVQSGLATDESGKAFFLHQLSSRRLLRFLDFENKGVFFRDVHAQFRFALMTTTGQSAKSHHATCEFGWLMHNLAEISEPGRLVRLGRDDVLLFNPNSGTAPVFMSQRDFAINRQIYVSAHHISEDSNESFEGIDFLGELFNMTRAAELFVPSTLAVSSEHLPLYEAKYVHQYDHRFASFSNGEIMDCPPRAKGNPDFRITTKNYVLASEVRRRTATRGLASTWMCGFRDIASPTNERTAIFSIFPFAAVGNNINLVLNLPSRTTVCLIANANSLVFDYACRHKVSGMHVNIWIMKQLPIIPYAKYSQSASWTRMGLSDWILERVVELSYTAWDLQPFARDCGYDGPPFRWDEDRRFLLRCELDAAYFHLYGIARDDVDYIMETFPIVKRRDVSAHGEYRTKRVILEIYDAMQQAMDTGEPYQTRLDPPPADPRVAHTGEPPEWVQDMPLTTAGLARSPAPPIISDAMAESQSGSAASPAAQPKRRKPASAGSANPKPNPPPATPPPAPPVLAVPAAIPIMPPPTGTYTDKLVRMLSLKQLATPEAIGELVAALGDDDGNVRWLAGSTLLSLQDARVVAAMRAFMAQTNSEIARQAVQEWLERIEQ